MDSAFTIAAAVVVLYFAARTFTHGLLRPVLSTLSLGAGICAGTWVFHQGTRLLAAVGFNPEPITTTIVAVIAGGAVFLFLRKFGHGIVEVFFQPGKTVGRVVTGPVGALLSLIPALLFLAVGLAGLRLYATLAELDYVDQTITVHRELTQPKKNNADGASASAKAAPRYPAPHVTIAWRDTLENKLPGVASSLDRIDPIASRPARHLAQLIIITRSPELAKKLGRSRRVQAAFDVPDVAATLRDPDLLRQRDESQHLRLLRNPVLQTAARNPQAAPGLTEINPAQLLPKLLE